MDNNFTYVLENIKNIIEGLGNNIQMLQKISDVLKEEIDEFDWVGFYIADKDKKGILNLGPFAGESTEHKRIKFGEGICGQAAVTLKTFVVQDVSREENYLSCSPEVQSEIVVPIFTNGKFAGELDIDSHKKNAITPAHRKLCEAIASLLRDEL